KYIILSISEASQVSLYIRINDVLRYEGIFQVYLNICEPT
ncbi:MAG: hypothetical protein ACJA01_004575, partial [Saprospiraceae bacterium]